MKKNLLVLTILCSMLAGCGGNESTSNKPSPSTPATPSSSVVKPTTSETPSTPIGNTSSSTIEESCTPPQEDNKIHLVLLTGQSGARGKAQIGDLDDEEKEPNYDVDIMADGLMMPALGNIPETIGDISIKELEPGFGDTASEFGPELGMGQTMASRYPKDGEARKSVIVKYTACGSTFISDWYTKSLTDDSECSDLLDYKQVREDENGNYWGPLTWNFFQLVDLTISTLQDEGYEVVIDGCAFIHGEQDTKYDDNMKIYEKALEYYVKDVREYLGDEDMPFVITEALTNSGKYCNDLKAMQRRVCDKYDNCTLITNEDLTSNTFEPWHFGKSGNYIIGNRIAAEFASYNDTRVVEEFEEKTIKVPVNADVTLPKYAVATYTNGYTGYSKIEYTGSYDKTTKGTYEVTFEASGCQEVTGVLNVVVCDEVFVDGVMNEYEGRNAIELGDLGKIYVTKGEEGLYISATINDTEIWTDGESWHNGDMGQDKANDDLRVYVSSGDASARTSMLLSSANLLRVYGDGVSLSDAGLPAKNWVYKGYVEGYYYRVTTRGIVNDPETPSGGLDFELYMPYDSLSVEADEIMLCFNYNNISMGDNGKKTAVNNYYTASGYSQGENLEVNDDSYISINDLI